MACSFWASLSPARAVRLTFSKRLSIVSKSFSCSSIFIISLSRIGSTDPDVDYIVVFKTAQNMDNGIGLTNIC